MSNDTPDNVPQDSQVPFISNRNEDGGAGVSDDMSTENTENSQENTEPDSHQVEEGHQPSAVSHQPEQSGSETDEDAVATSEADDAELTTDNTLDTGEVEVVSVTQSSSDPVPTVTFDYDDYYGVPAPPPRPVPVSERITVTETTKEKKSRNVPFFLGALAAGVVGAALTIGVLAANGTFEQQQAVPPTTTATAAEAVATVPIPAATTQIINDLGSAINPAAVAAKVVPSIVTITVFNDGETEEDGLIGVGSGSGVVVSRDGYIITNHHVIDGASDYRVEFEDGRVYTAELVGSDELTDLAVLQISADNLVPIDLGSSDALDLGDPAIAIGNPLGQDGGASVSVGIVSAFNRRVDFAADDFLHGMIQTDAAINSGSSGGALVNADGALIGITSAIGVSQAGPEGIGYAIPVELVKRISDEIIETGDVEHPFLGVTIGTYLDEAPDGAIVPAGSDIQTIEGTDSAAAQAGLQPGDIIVSIGGKPISDQTDLILAVRLYRVGDDVEFGVLRDGEPKTFTVTFGQRPSEFGG
jgi:S1-C subfamily serine protease